MPEPAQADQPKHVPHTDFQILLFIIGLCFVCGILLAVVAFSLRGPQAAAKEFDQSKQMLIAAKILNHAGTFEILEEDGTLQPARFDTSTKTLVPDENPPPATDEEIKEVAALRIRPLLTDKEGTVETFKERGISMEDYIAKGKKRGYANLPWKLFYAILPNESEAEEITTEDIAEDLQKAEAFIIPVSGFGLWGPIYGYLAVAPNGDDVIGTTWYEHAETPGLGANIAEAWWQKQFYGKLIFQESPDGTTNFETSNMGIIVVKGKVRDVYGETPKAKSAVDGMSGATLTGDGVTQAYRNSLTPYRQLFIKLEKEETENGG